MAEGSFSLIAGAVLVAVLVSCAEDSPASEDANRSSSPCADGQIHNLGVPGPFDKYASFEVVQGPVWFAVSAWEPVGVIDPREERGTLKLGPLDQPPVADANGHFASQTDRVEVTKALWSRLDISPGEYWLLGSANARGVSIQTCGEASVQEVVPTS